MAAIRVGGSDFSVQIDGPAEGPVLLLSNSLSSDLSMWDDQVPAWVQRFRVVRYDQRGHGGSIVPAGPYSMDQLGGDAIGIMDALGVEKAHFCGLSLGGMVGMWLLTHAPKRFSLTRPLTWGPLSCGMGASKRRVVEAWRLSSSQRSNAGSLSTSDWRRPPRSIACGR